MHHGSKNDFILGFAHSVCSSKTSSPLTSTSSTWDGKLSVQDIIEISKHAHEHGRTAYDVMTSDNAVQRFHIDKHHILNVQDNMNSSEFVSDLRRRVPGLLDSGYSVDQLKKEQRSEFTAVLQPERTATGWKINLYRLHQCLKFIYPWLPAQEYWRLYGDTRTYGKQKSVLLAIGNLNDEQLLNKIKIQSPDELWPVSIFSFADSRLNLELNLAGESSGWLNEWIKAMNGQDHKVYLTGDSMFLDAIADSSLDPKSDTNTNIYNYESVATKGEVSKDTGLRSGLNRCINRELPESLLPALSTNEFLLCCDHMFTRITERLLTLRVNSIFSLEAESVIYKKDRDSALDHFESNINARGVRSGHFKFHFESGKNKLSPVSLNKTCAQLISAPPVYFKNATYPHILDNVAPKISCPGELTSSIQQAINWPTKRITGYDCENLIWESHFKMYEICRLDPEPKLKDGKLSDSHNVHDYHFGVTENEVVEYVKHADIFHALMCFRYGKDKITPYMVKAVDIVPILLRSLPFHSIMRVSTEGGEHLHYKHQQHFFNHTSRGGGKTFSEPILAIFEHMYRQIRRRITEAPQPVQENFKRFVSSCNTSMEREPDNSDQSEVPSPTSGEANDTHSPTEPDATSTRNTGPENHGCLTGCRFVIAGSLQSYKMTHERLTGLIKMHGGKVLNAESIPNGLPVDIILITTQKECDKKEKINSSVATAYQRKWKIVSPEFVTTAIKDNALPCNAQFSLKLDRLEKAP